MARRLRVWAILATALVSVGLNLVLAPVSSSQVPEPDPQTNLASPPIIEPAPEVEALTAAVDAGEPVPVESLTTSTVQVTANPDSSFTAEIAPGPVRIEDPDAPGEWIPIDTSLEHTPNGLEPRATTADVAFSDGGQEDVASLETSNRTFTLDWPTSLPVPLVEGDTATYHDVLDGVDLALRATPSGFEHSFIVKAPPPRPLIIQVPMELEGLRAVLDGTDALSLLDAGGHPIVEADPALMWDSSYDAHLGGPERTARVDLRLVISESGPILEMAPDPAFLGDPKVVYPVVIDPTTDLSVSKDTYVEVLYPTQSYGTDNELKVGAIDSAGQAQKARSFLKFGLGAVSGKDVISATLKLYENHSWSCTPKGVDVYRLDSSWSGPTWNNQPNYGPIYASKSFAYGYSSACPNSWVGISGGGGSGRTLTQLVQGWADGTITNEGISVRASTESDLTSWKKFNSSDHTNNQPYLEVNYNTYPEVPGGFAPDDLGTFYGTSQTVGAIYEDPDVGDEGSVRFWIYDSQGRLVDANGTPTGNAYSIAGTQTPTDMELGASAATLSLPPGTYTWRGASFDGRVQSPKSPSISFSVVGALPLGVAGTVPGDSTQMLNMTFTQPLRQLLVRQQLGAATFPLINFAMNGSTESLGSTSFDKTVGAALDELAADWGSAPITDLGLLGVDGQPFTIPVGLQPYVSSVRVDSRPTETPEEEGSEPIESDPGSGLNMPRTGYPAWAPISGWVRGRNLDNGRGLITQVFVAVGGSTFHSDWAYEHDFKLREDGRFVTMAGCVYDSGNPWLWRRNIAWWTDMPKPYLDTDASDPCDFIDFTIGSYRPQRFVWLKDYTIRVSAPIRSAGGSPFVLAAQALHKECETSPWCVGISGTSPPQWLLVGSTRGRVPGCREWFRNKTSEPC